MTVRKTWVCFEKCGYRNDYDFAGIMHSEEEAEAWVAEKPTERYWQKGMDEEVED